MSRLSIPRPDDPRLCKPIPIVSLKVGREFAIAILGEFQPLEMHWVESQSRSVPCRTDFCTHCSNAPPRIEFFAPAISGGRARKIIFMVPGGCLETFRPHVRGEWLFIKRERAEHGPGLPRIWKREKPAAPLPEPFDVYVAIELFFFGPAPAVSAAEPADGDFPDADGSILKFGPVAVQAPGLAKTKAAEGGGA